MNGNNTKDVSRNPWMQKKQTNPQPSLISNYSNHIGLTGSIGHTTCRTCVNFTIYETASHKGYCYLCDETEGNRAANKTASCLLHYNKSFLGLIGLTGVN